MPLATWGWWFHHLSENRVRALKGAIKHALRWSPLASVDLLAVLGGHDLDPWVHRADARWSPSASMWRSQKVPRNWEYTHVQGAAQQMGLEAVEILSKGRNGFSNSWTFRARGFS